jgi:hypothetical protein
MRLRLAGNGADHIDGVQPVKPRMIPEKSLPALDAGWEPVFGKRIMRKQTG